MEILEYYAMFSAEDSHWWFVGRRLFLRKIFDRLGIAKGKSRQIVDVGAGTGGMMRFLGEYGKTVGVEPNPIGKSLARKRGIVLRKGSANATALFSASMDMVCFLDVLYHKGIEEGKALREALRILKPGGLILITDCAFQFLYGPHDVFVEGKKRYTIGQLTTLLTQSGLIVRYSTYTYFLLFPFFALWRLVERLMWHIGLSRTSSSDVSPVFPLMNSMLINICAIEAAFLDHLAFPWGSSLLILAQKT